MAKKEKKASLSRESAFQEIVNKFKTNPLLYIGSVLILVLVCITFLAGDLIGGGMMGSASDLTFGYYDKVPITWVSGNYFSRYYDELMQYYRNFMDVYDMQGAFSVWRQAFEMAAVHTAILQEVNKSNYTVPERTVNRAVSSLPMFYENGRFSPALFRQVPEARISALKRQVQEDLTRNLYYEDTFNLLVPRSEVEFISNMSANMRNFQMAMFNVDDYPDSEYIEYALNNRDIFRQIRLSMISVGTSEREAERILNSVREGTMTFEDAARSMSEDNYKDRGGDLGSRFVYELDWDIPSAEDRETIFALRRGEISEVIRVRDMWVFFRVEEEIKNADFDDSLVMDRVRFRVRNFERGRMEDWAISQANEFINDVRLEDFESVAAARETEVYSFGPVPLNYGSVDLFTTLESFSISAFSNQELTEMARNENFWRTAFSSQTGVPSSPIVQGSRVLVFLPSEYIDEDAESRYERLDNIAEIYSSYWLSYETDRLLIPYFMNSSKMDDRFFDTFSRLFMSN